jgi:hypothetical protein
MELNAHDVLFLVPNAHHLALTRPRADFEAGRKGIALHEERMVARGVERTG